MIKKKIVSPKLKARLRRRSRTRALIRRTRLPRLVVKRSLKHLHVQLIMPQEASNDASDKVIVAASTAEKAFKAAHGGNEDAALILGKTIAERARKAGIEKIAFDRSGYRYHGRIKSLTDGAREAGLIF